MIQLPFDVSKELQAEIENLQYAPLGKAKNLTGQTFNRLTVLGRAPSQSKTHWYVICSCPKHTIKTARGDQLTNGETQSCGCYNLELTTQKGRNNKKDISYQVFNFVQVLDATNERDQGSIIYNCQCLKCRRRFQNCARNIMHGLVKSCGCLKESIGELAIATILKENNISFVREKVFDSCRFTESAHAKARFDFYVNNSYLIEFDGVQHFRDGCFGNNLQDRQEKDAYKNQWCIENNIPLIRIPYTHLDELTIEDLKIETSKFIVRSVDLSAF